MEQVRLKIKKHKLRCIFYSPEPFTLMARDDSGINTFDDLKGKRVNVGDPGSGTRATLNVILQAKGWTDKEFKVLN